MKPTILFVDDERNIISGLRRMMHKKSDDWSMLFAEGGPEAVKILDTHTVDMLVTDMRMPSVNGADLLRHAACQNQGVVRFILSGEADIDLTCETVGLSHQFFSKPCEPGSLIAKLDEPLFFLREASMREAALRLSNWECLPTNPKAFDNLWDSVIVHNDIDRATSVVATDPAMAMRALQLANSAYFGRPCKTLSIAEAVERIGLRMIEKLLRSERFCKVLSRSDSLTAIASNAVQTARELANFAHEAGADSKVVDNAYAVGLLSWIGELAELDGICELRGNRGRRSALVSAYLSTLYGLPDDLKEALTHYSAVAIPGERPAAKARSIGHTMFLKAVA